MKVYVYERDHLVALRKANAGCTLFLRLINLLGVSESKVQMVAPRGTVSALVLVSPLVTSCPWRLLITPRLCSTPLEFVTPSLL